MNEKEQLQEEIPVEEIETLVDVETITTQEEGVTVNVTIQQPEATSETTEETLVEDKMVIEALPEMAAAYSVTSPDVLAVNEPGESGLVMVDVITGVLGEYRRQTYTVQEYDSSGNLIATSTEYVPGLAGLDYAWITGAILFGIVLAAGFKLLGGLIRS